MERYRCTGVSSRCVLYLLSLSENCNERIGTGTVKSSMLSQPNGPGGASGGGLDAFKRFVELFGISNEQGAVVPVWLAIAEEPAKPELRGLYWDRMRWMWVCPWSLEIARQNRLWDKWCSDAGVSFP